jgi:imidazolonepropionase-like amidohydrolase
VIVIEGVTLIDGTGAPPRPDAALAIAGDRILAVGATGELRYPGADVREWPGRYVIPGLFDTHTHVTFLRYPDQKDPGYDRATSERMLRTLLAMGITTVRSLGGPTREAVALREDVRAGRIAGPRLFVAGAILNRALVPVESDARAEVRRQAEAGVDFIKVYADLPAPLVRAAIEEAHLHGLRVVGHLQATTWQEAADAGIDFITHGAPWSAQTLPPARRAAYTQAIKARGGMRARVDWLESLDLDGREVREMIAALVRHHVDVDPTLVAYETKFRADSDKYANNPLLWLAPPAMRATWRLGSSTDGWGAADFASARAAWPKVVGLVKRYHEQGVRLLTGSDTPNPWVVPGISLHQELELLASAGIKPLEVLTLATRNGAQALGIADETGTLEPGKRADMVVLSANPLADIANTRRIEQVLLGGRVLERETLLR